MKNTLKKIAAFLTVGALISVFVFGQAVNRAEAARAGGGNVFVIVSGTLMGTTTDQSGLKPLSGLNLGQLGDTIPFGYFGVLDATGHLLTPYITASSTTGVSTFAGSIGVSTSTPTASSKLSVQGGVYASGYGYFGGAVTATSTLSVTGLTTLVFASSTTQSLTGNLIINGYATTTGTNGNIATAGTLTVSGLSSLVYASSTTQSLSGNLLVGGYATTTGATGNFATAGNLTVIGTSNFTGLSTLLFASSTTQSLTGNLIINGYATTTGTNGNIATAGTLTVTKLSTLSFASSTTQSLTGNLIVNGYATTTGTNGNIDTAGALSVAATTTLRQYIGSGTPSVATSTGVGPIGTAVLTTGSTDLAGEVTVMTATSSGAIPSPLSTIFTLTYGNSTQPFCVFSATNATSSVLSAASSTSLTLNQGNFQMVSGSAGLVASTTYKWSYHCN